MLPRLTIAIALPPIVEALQSFFTCRISFLNIFGKFIPKAFTHRIKQKVLQLGEKPMHI